MFRLRRRDPALEAARHDLYSMRYVGWSASSPPIHYCRGDKGTSHALCGASLGCVKRFDGTVRITCRECLGLMEDLDVPDLGVRAPGVVR